MITDEDLDRRLWATAGVADDDLPELPAAAWSAITRAEPATVLAGPQLAEGAQVATRAQSRLQRHRRRLLAAALVGAAATGVVVAGLPGRSPDSAFADWTSIPDAVPPAAQAEAETSCIAALDETAEAGGVFAPLVDPTAVLVDQRGSWTYTVVLSAPSASGEHRLGDCLQLDAPSRLGGSSLGGDPVADRPADGVVVVAAGSTSGTADGEQASTYAGRSAPDVVAVSVVLPDGNRAQALLRDGWWSVWFPGDTIGLDAAEVTVRTTLADGSVQEAPLDTLWG